MNNFIAHKMDEFIKNVQNTVKQFANTTVNQQPPTFTRKQLSSALASAQNMYNKTRSVGITPTAKISSRLPTKTSSALNHMPGNIMNDQGSVVGFVEDGKKTMFHEPQPALDEFHRQVQGVSDAFNNLPYGSDFSLNAYNQHHSPDGNKFQYISPQGMHQIMTDPSIPKPKGGTNMKFTIPQGANIQNTSSNIHANSNYFNDIIDKLFSHF